MTKKLNSEMLESIQPFLINKYFFIWIFYLIIAAGIVIIIGPNNIMNIVRQDKSFISYGIIASFTLLFLYHLKNTIYFNWQYYMACKLYSLKNNILDKQMKVYGSGIGTTYIKKLIEAYDNLTVGEVSQSDFVYVLENKLYGKESIVNTGSNLLITLGLIGTVFGLTVAMMGLEGVLSNMGSDPSKMLAALKMTLSGMGTAFYTTLIAAPLGGVLLRLLINANEGLISNIIFYITETSAVYVLPKLKKNYDINLVKVSNNLLDLSDSLKIRIERLNDFLQRYENIVRSSWELSPVLEKYIEKLDSHERTFKSDRDIPEKEDINTPKWVKYLKITAMYSIPILLLSVVGIVIIINRGNIINFIQSIVK